LLEKKGAKIYVGKPDDLETLEKSLEGADTVIHCAGVVKALKKEDYIGANVEFTKNILSLLSKKQKFVFISSLAAAGPSNSGIPIDEKAEPNPITSYGKSKLLAENYVKEWGKKNSNNYIILRPSVVYGPRERNVYNYFKLIKKGFFFLLGGGKKKISIIHVEDLVKAVVTAVEHSSAGETYFISSDKAYSWEEIGCTIQKALNKTYLLKLKLPEFIGYPVASFFESLSLVTRKPTILNVEKITEMKQHSWLCSNRKIKDELKWKPKLSLEDGIKQTANWYIKEKWI
jgi:nucleoside-diphosphate-sugar epimerase